MRPSFGTNLPQIVKHVCRKAWLSGIGCPGDFKFISHSPYGSDAPVRMAALFLKFLADAFNMHIHGTGVADIFISPYLVKKLFPGKDLIGRGGQKIEEFQFFRRHFHGLAAADYGVIGPVNDKAGVFHAFYIGGLRGGRNRLVPPKHRLYPCH